MYIQFAFVVFRLCGQFVGRSKRNCFYREKTHNGLLPLPFRATRGSPLQCHPSDKPSRPIQEVRGHRRPSDRCRRQFSHVASPLIQIAEVHFGIAASQLIQMNRIRIRMNQQVSVQLTHWKPSQWNLCRADVFYGE